MTSLTFRLGRPSPKKHSIRFDAFSEDAAVATIYLKRDAWLQLSQPALLEVTITNLAGAKIVDPVQAFTGEGDLT